MQRGQAPMSARRGAYIVVSVAFIALAALYIAQIMPGVPADEPSHWSTVLMYERHGGALPVLGHRGVSYEAQQGPVSYWVDAILVGVVRALGGSLHSAFYVVRTAGCVEMIGAAAALRAVLRGVRPSPLLANAAAALMLVNPMLLAMSASVQNDSLALALALACVAFAVRRPPGVTTAILCGLVGGLAVLTKLTDWPALVAVALVWLWTGRRELRAALGRIIVMAVAATAVTGWWFVRNQALYGDLTARTATRRAGVSFPPAGLHGAHTVSTLASEVVTYWWLPTEYWRNAFHAGRDLKALLALLTVGTIFAGVTAVARGARPPAVVWVSGLLALVTWPIIFVTSQAVAPRTAYLDLPLWFFSLSSLSTLGHRRSAAAAWTLLVLLAVFVGVRGGGITVPVDRIALNA